MSRIRMMPENGTESRCMPTGGMIAAAGVFARRFWAADARRDYNSPMHAGDSIEDFCRVCKTDRMHTVIAAGSDGHPLRVVCGYCHSEHNYRGGPRVGTAAATP